MAWSENDIKKLLESGKIKSAKGLTQKAPVKQIKMPHKKSSGLQWLERYLPLWCISNGYQLDIEYRFDAKRKWRFDFAIPEIKAAVEFEGGIFLKKSGHNTAKHYTKDTEKYNTATVQGWRVIRVTAINYKSSVKQLEDLVKKNTDDVLALLPGMEYWKPNDCDEFRHMMKYHLERVPEPPVCKMFGCGQHLTHPEKLFGDYCFNHVKTF